jgi:putative ABC transport system permease protein
MSIGELLRLVFHNLLRMRTRVMMTAIGVLIGTAAVVILISLGEGLQRESLRGVEQMGALNEIQVFPMFGGGGPSAQPGAGAGATRQAILNDRTVAEFRQIPGVVAAVPLVRFEGGQIELKVNRLESYGANFIGLPPDQAQSLAYPVPTGTFRLGSGQAVIGWSIPENFFDPRNPPVFEPGKPFVPNRPDLINKTIQAKLIKQGEDNTPVERIVKLRVVGILRQSGGERDGSIYLSSADLIDINTWFSGRRPNFARNGYQTVLVRVKSVNEAETVLKDIQSRGFGTFSPLDFIKQIRQQFLGIQAVLGGIGAIALLVAAFGIANTMVMAIYERTREIGLMKAIGASDRDVLLVFLFEAAAIGFLGGALGLLTGWAGGSAVGSLLAGVLGAGAPPGTPPPQLVVIPPWLPLFAVGFATLIGLLSGLYPAIRATRLDPITALRQP